MLILRPRCLKFGSKIKRENDDQRMKDRRRVDLRKDSKLKRKTMKTLDPPTLRRKGKALVPARVFVLHMNG